jgi:hypothetical protein
VVHIGRWSEFVSLIESTEAYKNWAFRGQSDAEWPLAPSLSRHVQLTRVHRDACPIQEQRTLRIFKRKAHLYLEKVPDPDDDFHWLALMQLHGAPTRLLDFTWSPYVAAFFALNRAFEDSALWAINTARLWLTHDAHPELGMDHERMNPRQPGNLQKYFFSNTGSFVWYGEPFVMTRRLVAQSGTFLVPGTLFASIDEIISHYPRAEELLTKFVFDSEAVRGEAMSHLYSMNIGHSTVFPDLDGLARSMAWEFEHHWEYDVRTMKKRPGWRKL